MTVLNFKNRSQNEYEIWLTIIERVCKIKSDIFVIKSFYKEKGIKMPVRLKDLVSEAKAIIDEANCLRAQKLIQEGYTPLDVRESYEYLAGTLPMSVHISRGLLEPKCDLTFDGHDPRMNDLNKCWLVFCQAGGRGALATYTLRKMGYKNVVNLLGGFKAWKDAGYDITCPPTEEGLMFCNHPWNPVHEKKA